MSDEEWAFFEGFILADRAPNGHKPTNHRLGFDRMNRGTMARFAR
jgi:hypothetical protein